MRKTKSKDPLVGKFFHSNSEGKLKWQGHVLSVLSNDGTQLYLVQLYEWFMGTPSKQVIVPMAEMVGWDFYDSSEDMEEAWLQYKERQGFAK
jgi:hypothetical protein